ncbi:hypothetical protein LTR95_016513 [Oleoguttula sp. CCFEE 5521]
MATDFGSHSACTHSLAPLTTKCPNIEVDIYLAMAAGEDLAQRQLVSVYDAVAGLAGYEGFVSNSRATTSRDTTTAPSITISPEEVLFRRQGAPVRYQEDDVYAADRQLRLDQRLPSSDLVKAIHAYASDFYAHAMPDVGEHNVRSLDETALLALGILLEEAAAEVVGQTGDLALLEGPGSDASAAPIFNARHRSNFVSQRSVVRDRSRSSRSTSRSSKHAMLDESSRSSSRSIKRHRESG